MPTMFNISTKPSNDDALLRVYATTCTLNVRAATLLGLDGADAMIQVTYDFEEFQRGRMRLYISGCGPDTPRAYRPVRRARSWRIYSTELARSLSERLDGPGTYRICPEVSSVIGGRTYYEIFFKKYE